MIAGYRVFDSLGQTVVRHLIVYACMADGRQDNPEKSSSIGHDMEFGVIYPSRV